MYCSRHELTLISKDWVSIRPDFGQGSEHSHQHLVINTLLLTEEVLKLFMNTNQNLVSKERSVAEHVSNKKLFLAIWLVLHPCLSLSP